MLLLTVVIAEGSVAQSGFGLTRSTLWEYDVEMKYHGHTLTGTMRYKVEGTSIYQGREVFEVSIDGGGQILSGDLEVWYISGYEYITVADGALMKSKTKTTLEDSESPEYLHEIREEEIAYNPPLNTMVSPLEIASEKAVTSKMTRTVNIVRNGQRTGGATNTYTLTFRIICLYEIQVSVPAGDYYTHVLKIKNDDGSYTMSYVTTEVGEVKTETYTSGGQRIMTTELAYYEVGEPITDFTGLLIPFIIAIPFLLGLVLYSRSRKMRLKMKIDKLRKERWRP